MRHLVVDGFCFTGVRIPSRKVLHVRLDNRVCKHLVLLKDIKIFVRKVSQSNTRIFTCPVFEMITRKPTSKNIHRAQEDDILFLGINHLHFQIKGANRFTVFVGFSREDIVTNALMFCIITQTRLWNWRFQMINFDVQQVLNKRLRDMLVAEHKPEHNRVRNVI